MYTINDFKKELEINNSYVELDFDKTKRLADIVNTEWVVQTTTRIKTKFGNKLAVVNPDGEFFYANDIIADKLDEVTSFPVTIFITEKTSKTGNIYTTCYIQNERVSVKDYVNKKIVIVNMREIETKYGTKYVAVTNDNKEMITSWKSLYKLINANSERIIEAGGIELYPVERYSDKYEKTYIGYADKPDTNITENPMKTKKKFINKNKSINDIISDGDIYFNI